MSRIRNALLSPSLLAISLLPYPSTIKISQVQTSIIVFYYYRLEVRDKMVLDAGSSTSNTGNGNLLLLHLSCLMTMATDRYSLD
ncbi:hypothetical protein BT69DRAFT_1344869 [Atractiella rhizophila]|nr:hypothetical protein BT69DRAFT_1344869 [Atractiella rhizophila]